MLLARMMLAVALLGAFGAQGLLYGGVSPVYEGAEGYGALSLGGSGGRLLWVSRLDDDVNNPPEGSLRWALNQRGPRIVKFAVAGTVSLKGRLVVSEPYLTIDGSDAPAKGICIRHYPLEFSNTHDIVVRYIRLRRGDVSVLLELEREGLERPRGSAGLDCLALSDCEDVLIDHCSISWSCDELVSVMNCKNVTVQWCLLSEPLGYYRLHPYGDNHAYCANNSASKLTIHHCLFAHYVMRGPQFECNDVRATTDYNIKQEAVNNVVFDYSKSGSRYTTGIENDPEEAAGRRFYFQFVNNIYIGEQNAPEIEAETKHGVIDALKVYVSGNIGPHRPDGSRKETALVFANGKPISKASSDIKAQLSSAPLFSTPVPVTVEEPQQAYRRLLAEVGCSSVRDDVDRRILDDVAMRRFTGEISSQSAVGGWPSLDR